MYVYIHIDTHTHTHTHTITYQIVASSMQSLVSLHTIIVLNCLPLKGPQARFLPSRKHDPIHQCAW